MSSDIPLLESALRNLLTELFDGPSPTGAWVLGRGDRGLLADLDALSAETASRPPMPGRSTIAAHANHVCYSIELLNRWADGEENPFANADWEGSWNRPVVSDTEWRELLAQLRRQANAWINAIQKPRDWDEISLTGALASAAHVAYHLGAIRQLILGHGI